MLFGAPAVVIPNPPVAGAKEMQMSEEINPRPTPTSEVQSIPEQGFAELRREVIESRNLVIKTDNLLKNLHAELKQMGRKQENFEKRHWVTSVTAYVIFAVISMVGAFSFARSEIRSAREDGIANDAKVKQLTQEVDGLRRAEAVRREASEKAARAYDLLGSEKEGPGLNLAMDQAMHLDRSQVTRLEAKAIDDRAAGMKAKIAQGALERGNAAFRRNDWATAAQELTRYTELVPGTEENMVWFRLGNALTQSKDFAKAIPPLEKFIKSTGGTKTAQYAGYLLGTSYEETNNADRARQVYERAAGLYPGSEFAPLIRGRLRRLGQSASQQQAAQPAAQAAAPAR